MLNIYLSYINYYSAFTLLILMFVMIIKKSYFSYAGKQLIYLLVFVILLNIFEGTTYLFDGNPSFIGVIINHSFNFLVYVMTPIFLGLLGRYIYYLVKYKRVDVKTQLIFFIPPLIVVILIIINIFVPFVYNITDQNVYERLSGYRFVSYFSYFIGIYIFVFLIYHSKKLKSLDSAILIMAFLIGLLGSLIQIINQSIVAIYPFMGISILVVSVYFESIGQFKDDLTKLFSRKKAYEILKTQLLYETPFQIVLFDIDNLKEINDKNGHLIGDQLLISFSKELMEKFKDSAIIFRLGGDEFMMFIKERDDDDIMKMLNGMNNEFYFKGVLYKYYFSYGIAYRNYGEKKNIDELLSQADKEMYQMKSNHKD